MSLSVISLNYKTAPLELREHLARVFEPTPHLLEEIRRECAVAEVMLISTCNRIEFYIVDEGAKDTAVKLLAWIKRQAEDAQPGCGAAIKEGSVTLRQRAALTHLFRVAGSLESMVLGEPQILGQVKEAFQFSVSNGFHGQTLAGLMPRVFRAAKRVRSETNIARFPVSVSFVAVQLASKIFDSLADKNVMVVGAGDMAELTVEHLLQAGINRLCITNRTYSNAVILAERFHGTALRFEELERQLAEVDIVITSTGAREYVITLEMVKRAAKQRRGAPIFFIDIALPRDVDPAVNGLADIYCYDIDDLQAVTDANRAERERDALLAQRIVEEEIDKYEQWSGSLSHVPTIKALRRRFEEVGEQEVEKFLKKLGHLSGEDAREIRGLVRNTINKLLHTPSMRLKQPDDGMMGGGFYGDALETLFDLELDPPQGDAPEQREENKRPSSKVLRLPLRQQ